MLLLGQCIWACKKRMPSLSWSVTSSCWLLAEFPGRTKGLLCAPTTVTPEYLRSQNSTQPLQGVVLVSSSGPIGRWRGR